MGANFAPLFFCFCFLLYVFIFGSVRCLGLVGGELGDGLGALGDGVLGELSGEDEADGGLDLPGGEGGLAILLDKACAEERCEGVRVAR